MDTIYKNIEEYNTNKNRKVLIVFDGMIADMLSNKKVNPIVLNYLLEVLAFIAQSYCAAPKYIKLDSTHYFIEKIPNKQELQQTAFNHSSDIDFKDSMNLYKKCTAKPYSFLVIYATLASGNLSCFRNNILEKI